MTWVKWVMLFYGGGLIAMGLDGYFGPSASLPSLIAGGGSGLIVLVGLFLSLKMATPRVGYIMTLFICLMIAGRFGKDAFGEDPYPATIAFVASIVTFLCLLSGHLMAMKAKKSGAA